MAVTVTPLQFKGGETADPESDMRIAGRRRGSAFSWIGGVITGIGVLLALFAAFLFLFTPVQASRAQHQLLAELRGSPGFAVLTGHVPADGKAVAILQVPAMHLDQIVVEGTSASDLTAGPGLMPGSALPGTPGNSVIAGRRYLYGSPFASLGGLRAGDLVKVVSGYGSFTYKVDKTYAVEPGESDPIAPTADNRLTLVTSNGSLAPTGRVVAVAKLVGQPVNVQASPLVVAPRSERALSGQPGALLPTILWALALLGTIGVTVRLYRRWAHTWPTYLMTTPILLAFAFLLFQNAARLLPATL
jgi:sortase A